MTEAERQTKYELGDAIDEKTSEAIVPVVDRHGMAGLVELVGARETSRTRSDDGDVLAGARSGRLRRHPAHLKALVDDGALYGKASASMQVRARKSVETNQ